MKSPKYFLDADDDLGSRAIGMADARQMTLVNLHAECQVALDRLARGKDGDRVTLVLTRHDMTDEELAARPEE